jgi:hypothetical protein
MNCSAKNLIGYSKILSDFGSFVENNLRKIFELCLKKHNAGEKAAASKLENLLKSFSEHSSPVKKPVIINDYRLTAYPESNIQEVLDVMNQLKIDSVPIVKHPWKKELLGFIKRAGI